MKKLLKPKSASQIPGWTSEAQHIQYQKLLDQLPDSPKILEIGCGWGRSTWAWLDILPKTAEYFILDNFCLSYRTLLKTYRDRNFLKRVNANKLYQKDIFDQIIIQHPNYFNIKEIWNMSGKDWIQSDYFTTDWDLVYFDDDHSYDAVTRWLQIFSKVPIVCGDDYLLTHLGVKNGVDDYCNNNPCIKEIMPGNFFIIKNTN